MTSAPVPSPPKPLSTNTPTPQPKLQPWDYLFSQIAGATRKSAARHHGNKTFAATPCPHFPTLSAVCKTWRNFTAATYFWGRSSSRQEEKCSGGGRQNPKVGQGGWGREVARAERAGGLDLRLVVTLASILRPGRGWWWGVLGKGKWRGVSPVFGRARQNEEIPVGQPSCFYEPSGPRSCCCCSLSLLLLFLFLLLLLPACLSLTAPTAADASARVCESPADITTQQLDTFLVSQKYIRGREKYHILDTMPPPSVPPPLFLPPPFFYLVKDLDALL